MLALGANGRGRAGLLSALRPQDVFATSLYTVTGTQQKVTTGFAPDLVWDKLRDNDQSHFLASRLRGGSKQLFANLTNAEATVTAQGPQAFLSDGFETRNASQSGSQVSWSFRQADKFFKLGLFTHAAGTADTIDLSSLGVVGWVHIKRRDAVGPWYVWTRNLTAGNNLVLNTTAAQSTTNAFISVSGTTLTFAAGAPAGNYEIEAWAHDPDTTNGIVQCGSYTTSASGQATVVLGWQPQFLIAKASSAASAWTMVDAARGFVSPNNFLAANTSQAEGQVAGFNATATGFSDVGAVVASGSVVYCAIRAPI